MLQVEHTVTEKTVKSRFDPQAAFCVWPTCHTSGHDEPIHRQQIEEFNRPLFRQRIVDYSPLELKNDAVLRYFGVGVALRGLRCPDVYLRD